MKTSVAVAVAAKEGLLVGVRSMPSGPYDGHTVDSQAEQIGIVSCPRRSKSEPLSFRSVRRWCLARCAGRSHRLRSADSAPDFRGGPYPERRSA